MRNFITIVEDATSPKWTLSQAEELVRAIRSECPGFKITIVGGVQYRGYSEKDVDLSLEMIDLDGDHDEVARYLRSIGATFQGQIAKMSFECWHLKDGRRVDLFYELPRINRRFKRR
jgi:hypothetical protein